MSPGVLHYQRESRWKKSWTHRRWARSRLLPWPGLLGPNETSRLQWSCNLRSSGSHLGYPSYQMAGPSIRASKSLSGRAGCSWNCATVLCCPVSIFGPQLGCLYPQKHNRNALSKKLERKNIKKYLVYKWKSRSWTECWPNQLNR